MKSEDRIDLIKREIERHPGINKTNLAGLVKDAMAKNTAFKTIEILVQNGNIIERKDGKMVRYYPLEAGERELESFPNIIKEYIQHLTLIQKEHRTYPHNMQGTLYRKIRDQSDSLSSLKERLQVELSDEGAMQDAMACYDDYESSIRQLLFDKVIRYEPDMSRCLTNMRLCLRRAISRRTHLKKQKVNKKDEQRKALTNQIYVLHQIEDKLFEFVSKLLHCIESIQHAKTHTPNSWERHPLVMHAERLEYIQKRFRQGMDTIRDDVEKWVAYKNARQESDQMVETGFKEINQILDTTENNIIKTKETLDRLHRDTLSNEAEQNLYDLMKDIKKYVTDIKIHLKNTNA